MRKASAHNGFSLIEMTLVLLILSVVAAMFVAHESSVVASAKKDLTLARFQAIQDTLVQFRQVYHRLPCPANGTLTIASHNLGIEAADPGVCDGPTPAANFSGTHVVMGTVPTKTLGLPDDDMYDGWGRRITYAVDPLATSTCAFTTTAVASITDTTAIHLIVNDENGNDRTVTTINGTPAAARALYVLVSHGPNGHGGFLPSGAREDSASLNADELTNCHCGGSPLVPNPSATAITNIFVERPPLDNAANPQSRFDDLVTYATREQILSQAEQAGITGGETCTGSSSSSSSSSGASSGTASSSSSSGSPSSSSSGGATSSSSSGSSSASSSGSGSSASSASSSSGGSSGLSSSGGTGPSSSGSSSLGASSGSSSSSALSSSSGSSSSSSSGASSSSSSSGGGCMCQYYPLEGQTDCSSIPNPTCIWDLNHTSSGADNCYCYPSTPGVCSIYNGWHFVKANSC
jgi:prepilin-type N-terminal cleavage/methylation domain-containing protein